MRLHTVFVTHNRLDFTKQAIESFLATVDVPYSYVVVDNRSTDGTPEWLAEEGHPHVLLARNRYPGYAANRGWELAPERATFLQRADNDMVFLPGWRAEVVRAFRRSQRGSGIGQVGLRTAREENNVRHNTGGNCVIRRELFDAGLRYDERPWPKYRPGMTEDTYFSPAVEALGYSWVRVRKSCLLSLAPDVRDEGAWDDPYYRRTFGERGIIPPWERPTRRAIARARRGRRRR